MTSSVFKSTLRMSGLAASLLILASGAAMAQGTVTLTAKPTTTTLPDGQTVPMWGLFCNDVGNGGASCATLRNPVDSPAAAAADAQYDVGQFAVDSAGTVARVTTAGTSGATAAVFNLTPGATTTDNTVTWSTIGTLAYYQTAYSTTWAPPVITVPAGSFARDQSRQQPELRTGSVSRSPPHW